MNNEKTDDWLIKNAIYCWLYHFPDHQWTPRYQQLVKRDTYLPEARPRKRAAKRSQSRGSMDTNATTGESET